MVDRRNLGNVLAATDFSEGGRAAVERAARLPLTRGATLTLLHVVPGLHPDLVVRAEAAARLALEELADELRAVVPAGVDVFAAIERGEPFVEIARRAAGERAELIVVGRAGHRRWPRGVMGSTPDRLLRTTRVGTLVVVGHPQRPYQRPMFGTDRDGAAAAAIALMARLVADDVRGALGVHVVDPYAELLPPEYGLSPTDVARDRQQALEVARSEIEPALDRLLGAALDYDLRCIEGLPASTILELARAEQVDLIALGTHGRRGLRRMLLGSVAAAVIRDSDIDALVVHTADRGWDLGEA